MPIRLELKPLYPPNWREIRRYRLDRAGNRCEKCGRANYSIYVDRQGVVRRVVLTIAHVDHKPANNSDDNLAVWCQKCHNGHDARHRAENRRLRRSLAEQQGQGGLFDRRDP